MEVLSWYCPNLGSIHCHLEVQVFQYLEETLNLGITFRSDTINNLVGIRILTGLGLKIGKNLLADIHFFFLADPCHVIESNRLQLLFLQLK